MRDQKTLRLFGSRAARRRVGGTWFILALISLWLSQFWAFSTPGTGLARVFLMNLKSF
jgi:hypothetical protein